MRLLDCLPSDERIASGAASGHRHVLEAVVEDLRTDDQPSRRYRECRTCGTSVQEGCRCPACDAARIAEFELE